MMQKKKKLKGNVLVSGTMEKDLNSEVLFRGLKRGITGKTSSSVSSLANKVQAVLLSIGSWESTGRTGK